MPTKEAIEMIAEDSSSASSLSSLAVGCIGKDPLRTSFLMGFVKNLDLPLPPSADGVEASWSMSVGPAGELVAISTPTQPTSSVHAPKEEISVSLDEDCGEGTTPVVVLIWKMNSAVPLEPGTTGEGAPAEGPAVIVNTCIPAAWELQAQPLSGGRILVVSHVTDNTSQCNAYVIDGEGTLVRSIFIGYGVSHVQVARASDEIWVGYNDEAIFSRSNTTSPGIACFSSETGEMVWEFNRQLPHVITAPPVDEVYAMNVADDGVWASYSKSFPIVRIDPASKSVQSWDNRLKKLGFPDLAVGANGVVAYLHGYLVVSITLKESDATEAGRYEIVYDHLEPSNNSVEIWVRGSMMHMVVDHKSWHALDIADAITDAEVALAGLLEIAEEERP